MQFLFEFLCRTLPIILRGYLGGKDDLLSSMSQQVTKSCLLIVRDVIRYFSLFLGQTKFLSDQ